MSTELPTNVSKINVRKYVISFFDALAFIVLLILPIIGYFQHEFYGYIAFSFLPAAVLINASIVLTYFWLDNVPPYVKVSWAIMSIAVLIFVLSLGKPQQPHTLVETDMILMYAMFVLAFPSSYAIAYIYYGISSVFGGMMTSDLIDLGAMNSYANRSILWLSFFIIGYVQWFLFIPFLLKKWEQRQILTHRRTLNSRRM